MRRFAALLERLTLTPARLGKLRLLQDYLRAAPDPDRGWGKACRTASAPTARFTAGSGRRRTRADASP